MWGFRPNLDIRVMIEVLKAVRRKKETASLHTASEKHQYSEQTLELLRTPSVLELLRRSFLVKEGIQRVLRQQRTLVTWVEL